MTDKVVSCSHTCLLRHRTASVRLRTSNHSSFITAVLLMFVPAYALAQDCTNRQSGQHGFVIERDEQQKNEIRLRLELGSSATVQPIEFKQAFIQDKLEQCLAGAVVKDLKKLIPLRAEAQTTSCRSEQPVNSIPELWPALAPCWRAPTGTEGMEITLVFSLRRDGTLIGKPRISYSKIDGDESLQRAFVASVLEALGRALPIPLTDSFANALAGRPLAVRFTSK